MSGEEPRSSGPRPPAGRGAPATGTARAAEAAGGAGRSTGRSAFSVGSGIFLSRLTGFARDLVFAAFFGTGIAADAFSAALRIPNILRNLLGEGTLSAAFVPIYSALLGGAPGEAEGAAGAAGGPAAARLARTMLGAMTVTAALLTAVGVLLAPVITPVIAPGFEREATELTVELVRILFPMGGAFMLAAWALGVLNSHRRFFLPFVAPVAWNLAQVGGVLLGARLGWQPLVHVLAWSALVGGVVQLGVQLPTARRLVGTLRPRFDFDWEPLRRTVRNMGPVAASQGVFQVSSLTDVVLASFLARGALAGLYFAQRIAYLPLSLFGISVAAAALPEMSREAGEAGEGGGEQLRVRLANGFFQILFFVFPSAVAMILFGDLMVRVLFQRGEFSAASTELVGLILVAYAVGVVAASSVKLFASGFHAMQDTRTPLRYTAVAVGTGIATGAVLMWPLGAPGLALGGAVGSWLNVLLLWRGLRERIGALFDRSVLPALLRVAGGGVLGAGAGVAARRFLEARLGVEELLPAVAVLAGTLVAAGVPYLLIIRKPPRVAELPDEPPVRSSP